MDDDSKARLKAASQQIEAGQLDKAAATAMSIGHPVAQSVILSSVFLRRGKYDEALPHFLRLLKFFPDDPSVIESLVICRSVLNGNVYDLDSVRLIDQVFSGHSDFHHAYTYALIRTQTPPNVNRRNRYGWLIDQLIATNSIDGEVAECGCYRGLSALVTCEFLKRDLDSFDGAGMHVFDSFAGLSAPTRHDSGHRLDSRPGAYAAQLEVVKENLSDFPKVSLYKGWIPERFHEVEGKRFRLVHVDVDLYEPTRDSFRFFFERLSPGGRIVCDDYSWEGARKAVCEVSQEFGVRIVESPFDQAMLIKPN